MPSLNQPQAEFLALQAKFKAFVAGFGSGKTWVGGAGHCKHAWEHPRVNAGYFAPTYGQIHDIFYPTIEEVARDWGLTAKIKQTRHEVQLYSGRQYRSTIICRSLDKPEDIVGFKIGHAQIDEIDLLKPVKASTAWRKVIARMRYKVDGLRNGIDVTTTPEGFRFVYQTFVKAVSETPELAKLYALVQASTFDNEANLPADYIPSLVASYPPQLIKAYLRGMFVNLTAGSVYADFDRVLNHTDDEIKPGDALHVGMDFNVLKMAAIVFVVRNGEPHAVAELTGIRDTPAMAKLLKERFKDKGHTVVVYPDASGQNTSSKNASESDLSILRSAGLMVQAASHNPAIKDRINAKSALILNGEGKRRFKVNTRLCPVYTEALEQQVFDEKTGDPDKKLGHDHPNDAGGYFLVKQWPLHKPVATITTLRV
jgi:hypothetical protein